MGADILLDSLHGSGQTILMPGFDYAALPGLEILATKVTKEAGSRLGSGDPKGSLGPQNSAGVSCSIVNKTVPAQSQSTAISSPGTGGLLGHLDQVLL